MKFLTFYVLHAVCDRGSFVIVPEIHKQLFTGDITNLSVKRGDHLKHQEIIAKANENIVRKIATEYTKLQKFTSQMTDSI